MSEETPDYRKRGVAAFAHEFAVAWGGILGATLGLAMIMVSVTTPLDEAEAWWEWLITIPLALGVILVGGCGATLSGGAVLLRATRGWYGMALGRCPDDDYGPRVNNGARALADATYAACALALGVQWFRAGASGGELNWSMEGLLLAFSGIAFGVGSLIPRLYFRGPGRRLPRGEVKMHGVWLGLVLAVTLGAGLSSGVCLAFAEARERAEAAASEKP